MAYAIDLYFYCKEFRTLPRPGGLLDQDFYEMMLLKHVAVAYAERAELEKNKATSNIPKRPHI